MIQIRLAVKSHMSSKDTAKHFHSPNMTRISPINIPVMEEETEAGELLDVEDGLVDEPVEVACIEACELLGVLVDEGAAAELVAAAAVVLYY